MISNYIKIAWRNIARNRVYSAINIIGLALGLACVMLIALYIQDEVSFDRFQQNGKQIYRLVHDEVGMEGRQVKSGFTGAIQAETFAREIPEIKSICRIQGGGEELVKKGTDIISEDVLYADKSFFSMFTFPVVKGNAASALNNPNNVVITEDVAKKYFGNNNALGKVLQISQNGKFEAFMVRAVAVNPPVNSTISFKFLLSAQRILPTKFTPMDWFNAFLNSFISLKPGVDRQVVEQKMARVFDSQTHEQMVQIRKTYGAKISVAYKLQPLLNMHLDKDYMSGNGLEPASKSVFSYILGGIALFILLIACINFVNLTLSNSLRRGKEIGIRKMSGSSRAQLIRQFLGESFLLTVISAVIAFVLVIICLPAFNLLANKSLQLSYLFTWRTVMIFTTMIVLNALLAGFYPAVILSGFKPVQTIYGKLKISGSNYLGKSLVVLQFIIALFLTVGTIVMHRQFNFLINTDIGYSPQNIVDVVVPQKKNVDFSILKNKLSAYPFIKSVSGQSVSFTSWTGTTLKVKDKILNSVPYFEVDNTFINQLNIKILKGSNFRNAYGDTSECLVNQAFLKAANITSDPIGQKVYQDKKSFTIIGVTNDFHNTSLASPQEPLVLRQPALPRYGQMLVKIDGDQKEKALQAIQKEFKSMVTDYPCNYTFLTDKLAGQYDNENKWKFIITTASVISVLISCLGLFGLATLAIEQRVKEIGVRKVLGAGVAAITRLLVVNFIKLVITAIVIASPLAWFAMHKWLDNYPYRIDFNWTIIALAGIGSIAIAVLTTAVQAIKAAMANPVKSLRSE